MGETRDSLFMIQKNISVALWGLGFVCALFLVNEWQLELFASTVVLVFTAVAISFYNKEKWHVPNFLFSFMPIKILFAFWLLAFVSILHSQILSVSLMAFCLFSMMPLSFVLYGFCLDERARVLTAKFLAVVFFALSCWALIQFFVLGDLYKGRATHPLANPNSLAALLSLGFFSSVGVMLGVRDRFYKYGALVLALVLFGGVVAAGSRGALFALLPVMMIYLFFMRDAVAENKKELVLLVIGSGLFFYLSSFGVSDSQNLFNRVVEDQSADINAFTNNRVSLWAATVEMIKTHGIFGAGIGTYFLYFPEFRLSDDAFGTYYAHNDPMQYWVELGVLGPVLFYGFIIAVLGRTVAAVKQAVDARQRLMVLTPFCALGACVIHTHVTFNLYNLSIMMIVGFLLAVWFQATQAILNTSVKQVTFMKGAPSVRQIMLVVPFLVIGGFFTSFILGEHYTNKARVHLLAGDLPEFADDVLFAQNVGFHLNYRAYLLAVNVPMSLLEEQAEDLDAAQKTEITRTALNYIQHVRSTNPRSSSALFYLGKLKQIGDADVMSDVPEAADYFYAQAIKIDPLHIGSRMALSEIYETRGQSDQAKQVLEEGLIYRYSTMSAVDLYGRLAMYYLKTGEYDAQQDMLRKMHSFQKRAEAQMKQEQVKKENP